MVEGRRPGRAPARIGWPTAMGTRDLSTTGSPLMRELAARHPSLREALRADAAMTARTAESATSSAPRSTPLGQMLRLAWVSDAFAHRLSTGSRPPPAPGRPSAAAPRPPPGDDASQVSIGDPVLIHPGIYIVHGQIVIDGLVEVGRGAVISPWVTDWPSRRDVHGATIGAM